LNKTVGCTFVQVLIIGYFLTYEVGG
jgi:hypothetical protein